MDLPTRLLPTRGDRGDFAVSRWYFTDLPQGITAAHVQDPDFWQHVARNFRVNDEIVATAADGSFDMDLRVIELDPRKLWARIRLLRLTAAKPGAASAPTTQWPDSDGYTVEYSGAHRFRIVNRAGEVVAKDFATEADAVEALNNLKGAKRKAA